MSGIPEYEGVLCLKTMEFYGVRTCDGHMLPCSLSSTLRKDFTVSTADPSSRARRVLNVKEIKSVDPVAIGDNVIYRDNGDGTGQIMRRLERRNKLGRKAAGKKPIEQVIVANLDQVVVVLAAAEPAPNWNLLDRYLCSCEAEGLPAVVCITKADLVDTDELEADLLVYRDCGYPTLLTSSESGEGIQLLQETLKNHRSVLTGSSGVGKTTLLNVLQPGLERKTQDISGRTGKGRHTTRHSELYRLDFGAELADTPGMREFGLWRITEEELPSLFPEFRPYLGHCKFGASCKHLKDPGCAITQAVEDGNIHPRRYQSYLKFLNEAVKPD